MLTKEVTHEYILDQMKKINDKTEEMNREHEKFIKEQNEKAEQLKKDEVDIERKKVKQN